MRRCVLCTRHHKLFIVVDALNNSHRSTHSRATKLISFVGISTSVAVKELKFSLQHFFSSGEHTADGRPRLIKTINLQQHRNPNLAETSHSTFKLRFFLLLFCVLLTPFRYYFDLIATLKSIKTPGQSSIKEQIEMRRANRRQSFPFELTLFIFCVTPLMNESNGTRSYSRFKRSSSVSSNEWFSENPFHFDLSHSRAVQMRTTRMQEKKNIRRVILERLAETAGNCLHSGEWNTK